MTPSTRSILLASLLALAPAAFAQTPTKAPVTFYGVTFPAEIVGATSTNVVDYEKDHPGYGYSVGYRRGDQIVTVYIYDMKISPIPDDVRGRVVRAELEEARKEVLSVRRDEGRSIEHTRDHTIEDAQGRTRFVCSVFVFSRRDRPGAFDSTLCLGVVNGKFFKFRISNDQRPSSEAEARGFIGAWAKMLWP
jgi:hypothetical protein